MRTKTYLLLLAFALSICLSKAFESGDEVKITVNKVSPYANPTQSYRYVSIHITNQKNHLLKLLYAYLALNFTRYYDLPFCQPENPESASQTIGEKLSGNRKMSSLYQTKFLRICFQIPHANSTLQRVSTSNLSAQKH